MQLLVAAGLVTSCGGPRPSSTPTQAEAPLAPAARVLFVGDSYTFVGDVPSRVREIGLGMSPPVVVDVDSATLGGATLAKLYARSDVQEKLRSGQWSHVVIQEQSTETLREPDEFRRSAGLFASLVHDRGAQLVLYETWARRADNDVYKRPWSGGTPAAMQERIDAAYLAEAQDTRSLVARVGEARQRAMQDPATAGIELFKPDGSHPTVAAAYLAACVIFRAVTGKLPDGGGHPAELAGETARRLQVISHDPDGPMPAR